MRHTQLSVRHPMKRHPTHFGSLSVIMWCITVILWWNDSVIIRETDMGMKWVSQVMFIHNKSSQSLIISLRQRFHSWSWHSGNCVMFLFEYFLMFILLLLWPIPYLNMLQPDLIFSLIAKYVKCLETPWEVRPNLRGHRFETEWLKL